MAHDGRLQWRLRLPHRVCRGPFAMKLLQILLPLYDNGGEAYPKAMFDRIRSELTDAFGGVTAFLRSPAVGVWEDESGEVQRDDVVLFEVMADDLDRNWWQDYRHDLQERFC